MARLKADQPLQPSVLDRLLDDRPDLSRESAKSQTQILSELRMSVRRDLENLLNTRWRCRSWPAEMAELKRSAVGYGIPDLTAANLSTEEGRRKFLKTVESAIRMYEPRFKTVKVSPLNNVEFMDRTLRFRIEALMYAYPAPEQITFDSSLEPTTGNFEVRGGTR